MNDDIKRSEYNEDRTPLDDTADAMQTAWDNNIKPEHVYDGFNFDTTNVMTQMAAVDAALSTYCDPLINGLVDDVMQSLDDFRGQWKAAERLTSLLMGQGYRRFAMIIDSMEYMVNKSRYRGFYLDCFSPSITAVNVSARQVGNMISKQMINFLAGKEYQTKTIMDYEILIRTSTGGVR